MSDFVHLLPEKTDDSDILRWDACMDEVLRDLRAQDGVLLVANASTGALLASSAIREHQRWQSSNKAWPLGGIAAILQPVVVEQPVREVTKLRMTSILRIQHHGIVP